MPSAPQVIAAGELFIDLILSGFEGWPEPGKEIFAKHFQREIGGGPMITACGLAKLGSRSSVLGVAGTDTADWLVNRLHSNGVDTSLIQLDPAEPTAFTVIATGPHDRAFLSYAGANRGFEDSLRHAAKSKSLSAFCHVHLAYAPAIDSAAELLRDIHENGCTISLDVGWREEWLRHSRALIVLRDIDLFFPNELEAQSLTGERDPVQILNIFAQAGLSRVGLKLGALGAALLWDRELYFTGPYPVSPVDTTGAGDCFNAGFLHAWLEAQDPETCLRAANLCGAISTEAYGGIAGFPTPERLAAALAQGESCAK
jgi:sugar/nucleoside kinase (ribokinase family)